ncbi:hypothetical protein [Streptosporangium sp. NPDC002721]|uniref:hypothetical protein n=1 Tax=Streptosporangium sp. NPDC002721 TaxID=3366188 RepID=UPI0036B16C09
MGCGCNKKNQQVTRFVVVYDDGTESDPYTTAQEAAAEKQRVGATAPVKTVTVAAKQATPAAPASAPPPNAKIVRGGG